MDFTQLYEAHYLSVYKICLAKFKDEDLAKEITQEGFARAFEKLDNLRDEGKFLPWVTTIAINYGKQRVVQDQARYNQLPSEDTMGEALTSVFPKNPHAENADFINEWVGTLKELDRQIFLMKFHYGMTNAEISENIKKSLSTVKRRLALLRSALKEALQKETGG